MCGNAMGVLPVGRAGRRGPQAADDSQAMRNPRRVAHRGCAAGQHARGTSPRVRDTHGVGSIRHRFALKSGEETRWGTGFGVLGPDAKVVMYTTDSRLFAWPAKPEEFSEMPFVNVKVIQGVFSPAQKEDIVRKLTDALVEIEGENMRPVTWVVVEEVLGGDWGIGGQPIHVADVKALAAGQPVG
jgi:4-oxalocrotonate tautomerase